MRLRVSFGPSTASLLGRGKLRRLVMESAHIDHQSHPMVLIWRCSLERSAMIAAMVPPYHYANRLKSTALDLQSP
jgi:hypothetical protein